MNGHMCNLEAHMAKRPALRTSIMDPYTSKLSTYLGTYLSTDLHSPASAALLGLSFTRQETVAYIHYSLIYF